MVILLLSGLVVGRGGTGGGKVTGAPPDIDFYPLAWY